MRGSNVITPLTRVDVVEQMNELERGLSGRALPAGMLFIFPRIDMWPIHMRGMNFPIDLAWLDEQGVIMETRWLMPGVDILHYPKSPAKFVIELPSGYFVRYKVKLDDRFHILT